MRGGNGGGEEWSQIWKRDHEHWFFTVLVLFLMYSKRPLGNYNLLPPPLHLPFTALTTFTSLNTCAKERDLSKEDLKVVGNAPPPPPPQ